MRLDQTLVARGLAPSRARAQDLIKRGFVRVTGVVCDRPSLDIKQEAAIEVVGDAPSYVSRGAEKLVAALDAFNFNAAGKVALDIGASTGGFTEVLLARGARRVYAVDVGRDQLHARLRGDARVVSLENFDAREISSTDVPERPCAIVADVSFVSVTKVVGPALALAAADAWLVILVKPQFEAGRENVGSGGIVRDEAARVGAVEAVATWVKEVAGWTVIGQIPSPILGGSGNAEYLLGALRRG